MNAKKRVTQPPDLAHTCTSLRQLPWQAHCLTRSILQVSTKPKTGGTGTHHQSAVMSWTLVVQAEELQVQLAAAQQKLAEAASEPEAAKQASTPTASVTA